MAANVPLAIWPFDFAQSNLKTRIDYDANSNAIYLGWAQAGSLTSDATWRIVKNTYDGSNRFTGSDHPQDGSGNPSLAFNFVWDNRATYTYS